MASSGSAGSGSRVQARGTRIVRVLAVVTIAAMMLVVAGVRHHRASTNHGAFSSKGSSGSSGPSESHNNNTALSDPIRASNASGGRRSKNINSAAARPNQEEGREADSEILMRVRAAAKDPSDQASATLLDVIDGVGNRNVDEGTLAAQLEAIDALVERKNPAALKRIVKMDPAAEPYLGPTIIHALGDLGAAAKSESDRRASLDRLVSLLAEEKERRGADSAGNVIAIIEALGVLQHPDAAKVLESELFDPFHDIPSRTSIVQSLGQLGQRSSLAPLTHLRTRTTIDDSADNFTRALHKELIEAIDESLRIIQGVGARRR